jgi:hypothetical protein
MLCAAPLALLAQLSNAAPGANAVLAPHGATADVAEMVGRVIHVGVDKGETGL